MLILLNDVLPEVSVFFRYFGSSGFQPALIAQTKSVVLRYIFNSYDVSVHKCDGLCAKVLPEFEPVDKDNAFHMIGNIMVSVEAYSDALGTSNEEEVTDDEESCGKFATGLASLLWSHWEFRGHNIGGKGRDMQPICEIRLSNLIAEVKKVFPNASNVRGSKRYPWLPKFLSEKLNHYFRSTRWNDTQGEARLLRLYLPFLVCLFVWTNFN